jgi:hypothetical protein
VGATNVEDANIALAEIRRLVVSLDYDEAIEKIVYFLGKPGNQGS